MATIFKVTQFVLQTPALGHPVSFFCQWSYVPLKAVVVFTQLLYFNSFFSLPSVILTSDRLLLLETMVLDDLPNLKDTYASLCSSAMEDLEVDFDSGLEEDELKQEAAPEDSTIFVAFKGNIGDRDFEQKLEIILENVPGLLHMGNVPFVLFQLSLKCFFM